MKKNSLMRYIDSCVSNIARKIQDEFDESKHPRDKGGKFTSKGNEGRGDGGKREEEDSNVYGYAYQTSFKLIEAMRNKGADEDSVVRALMKNNEINRKQANQILNEYDTIEGKGGEGAGGGSETSKSKTTKKSSVNIDPETEDNIRSSFEYDLASIEQDADSEEEFIANAIDYLEITLPDTADTDERAMDNYGADAKTVAAVVNKMIEEFKSKKPEGQDMGYEEQEELDEEVKAGKETDKIVEEFEEGLDVVKQDADSDEEYKKKAAEYLSWALDATAKTDEQAMENYGVSSKVVADIVNKLRENLSSSSQYTKAPEDKGKKQLESALKGWWTRADEMVEDLKDAGYEDVDYVNDELMYVSKDGVDYRVSLDKAGRTITAKRVEIV